VVSSANAVLEPNNTGAAAIAAAVVTKIFRREVGKVLVDTEFKNGVVSCRIVTEDHAKTTDGNSVNPTKVRANPKILVLISRVLKLRQVVVIMWRIC
jgi:hypothetical protein